VSGALLSAGARRRLAWGTGLLWVESALRLGTVALVATLIARAVGPAGFGLLNLASALAALGTVALSRGLEWPLVSAVAAGRLSASAAVTRLLRVRCLSALVALPLAAAAGLLLRSGDAAAQAVLLIVALGIAAAVPLGAELAFRARADPLPGALARLSGTLLASGAKLGVLASADAAVEPQRVLQALALCILLETLLAAGVLGLAWRRERLRGLRDGGAGAAALEADPQLWRRLQQAARPLWGALLFGVLLIKLDLLIVGALLGDAAAGAFALAVKMVEVLCLLPVLLLDQWQPLRLAQAPSAERSSDTALFDTAFAFGILLALASGLLAPWFVPALFGPAYAATVPVLQCLGLAVPFIALDAARQRWLAAQPGPSAPPRLGWHLGLAVLVALPLWPLAAWSLGAVGVAAVTVLAWAVATVGAPQWDGRAAGLAAHTRRALWPWGRLHEHWFGPAAAAAQDPAHGIEPDAQDLVPDRPERRGDAPAASPQASAGHAAAPLAGVAAAGLRALFVHQSSALYGSDRALLGAVRHWIAHGGRALVLLPAPGPLQAELVAAGAEVHALSRAGLLKLERASLGPRGLLALAASVTTLRPLRRIDAVVAGRRIDLVHTQTLAVLSGAWWARWRGVPHLWHVHEIVEQPSWLARALRHLLAAGADRVVCNAHATAAWVLAEQPALRERLTVVWNSLDRQAHADPRATSPARAARLPHGVLRIGVIGRINRMKGQAVLIDAAERLHGDARLPAFELVIAGDAPPGQPQWQQRLQERVASSPLAPRTQLAGFVADVPALLATLDILVVPSTAPESFGLVALEAMAAGVPVVASRIGGLPEVLGEGAEAAGLLVPPGDARALAQALHGLLRDAAWRQRLGAIGRWRSQRVFADGAALLLREQLRTAGRARAGSGSNPGTPRGT
jgi:glycosyltransferase involved in cell wall biosynthesis/O-antigen/teichoic acid export membrane protein